MIRPSALLLPLALLAYSATASLSFASPHPLPLSTAAIRRAPASATATAAARRGRSSPWGAAAEPALRVSRGGSAAEEDGGDDAPAADPIVHPAAAAAGETEPSPEPATATTAVAASGSGEMGPNAPPPGLLRRAFPFLPWHRLPNLLTYLRCAAIPLLALTFYYPCEMGHAYTSALFAIASFTDYLDGYLARRWDITSAFGAFLDPVADKLMVSTALILLSGRYGAVVALPSAVILAREIAVSALREWMAQRGLRDAVKVGMQGKVKTAATMVALTMFLLVPAGEGGKGAAAGSALAAALYWPSMALLYVSAVVTVTSGSVYFRAAAPVLLGKE